MVSRTPPASICAPELMTLEAGSGSLRVSTDDAAQLIGRDDLVDRFADPVGEFGGLFDPRSCLRPHMDLDLPAVDVREEVLA